MKINELLNEGWGADEITPYANGYTIWHKKQSAVRGEGNYWVYKTPEEFKDWDDSMKWDLEKTIKRSEPIAKAYSYIEAQKIMKGQTEDFSPQEKMNKMSDYHSKMKALQDILLDPNTAKDPELRAEVKRRMAKLKQMGESATAGATSSGNIATVVNPQLSPGSARGKKNYTGSPWGGKSGTKSPPQPKAKQPKKNDGTAVNALDMKANIFGEGNPLKR